MKQMTDYSGSDPKTRYVNTDITDFSAVQSAIAELSAGGYSPEKAPFLTALQNANPETVKRAKKYNNMSGWQRNLGWIIMAVFVLLIAIIDADFGDPANTWLSLGFCIGIAVQVYHHILKKAWKLLTLSGSVPHPALRPDASGTQNL